jgi:hypothetical protein
VRQVDEHADPLHLADHVPAEPGQPAGLRLVGGRIGPADVGIVSQGQVPHAERVQRPEHAERSGDRMAAFGAEQRGHPAGGEDLFHVVRGQRDPERLRVAHDHPAGQVDLLEHGRNSTVTGQRGRHVDGPELRPDTAGREPGQVGVQIPGRRLQVEDDLARIVAVLPGPVTQRPRQVIVPVDQRKPPEHVPRRAVEVSEVEVEVGHLASLRARLPGLLTTARAEAAQPDVREQGEDHRQSSHEAHVAEPVL